MKAMAILWKTTSWCSSYNNYGNYVELRLKPGADAQQLLRMARRARISRFELMEPSLEEIFIDTVGKKCITSDHSSANTWSACAPDRSSS